MFKRSNENTNFGVEQNFDQETFPDLYYEIGVNQVFIDAFISNLTPLIVVAIILFSLLLLPVEFDISKILRPANSFASPSTPASWLSVRGTWIALRRLRSIQATLAGPGGSLCSNTK